MPTSTRTGYVRFFTKRCGKPAIAQRADRVVRPYRTFYGFAEHYAILRLRTDGESAASTPTDRLRCRRSLCDFAGAPCTGGVEPLPYATGGNFADSHWCVRICNAAPHNPFVTASPCHLPLHKGGFGACHSALVRRNPQRRTARAGQAPPLRYDEIRQQCKRRKIFRQGKARERRRIGYTPSERQRRPGGKDPPITRPASAPP